MFPYIIQGDSISIVVDSKSYIVNRTHIAYSQLREAIKDRNTDAIRQLVEPKQVVINYAKGNVCIEGDQFLWKGAPMHNALSTKMIEMLNEGFAIDPLVKFVHNLMENPSKRAVDELYRFLEKGNLPITEEGYFLAYKKVRDDYTDCHTGTISNHVGAIVEMERNQVDDDRARTCSTGLHFCSQEYLKSFGGARTMILEINPADVVSIPSDYNDTKGRCCRYRVVGELKVEPSKAFTRAVQSNADGITPSRGATDSEAFFQGYRAGYREMEYSDDEIAQKDKNDYIRGWNAGDQDRRRGLQEKYVKSTDCQTSMTHNANSIAARRELVDEEDQVHGSNAYRAGYHDGHRGLYHFGEQQENEQDQKDYSAGYSEGSRHRQRLLNSQELRTIQPAPAPAEPTQEYDRHGRPLSMTPDAIRKRRARAAAKNRELALVVEKLANAANQSKPKAEPTGATAWPFPADNK